ncbi:hypothetical protein STEG23_020692 [Scotinomys teguina]
MLIVSFYLVSSGSPEYEPRTMDMSNKALGGALQVPQTLYLFQGILHLRNQRMTYPKFCAFNIVLTLSQCNLIDIYSAVLRIRCSMASSPPIPKNLYLNGQMFFKS